MHYLQVSPHPSIPSPNAVGKGTYYLLCKCFPSPAARAKEPGVEGAFQTVSNQTLPFWRAPGERCQLRFELGAALPGGDLSGL